MTAVSIHYRIIMRAICSAALSLAFLVTFSSAASAQTNLIGITASTAELVGYSIQRKGDAIRVQNVGTFPLSGDVGHLLGNFHGSADKEVLRIRRANSRTFVFSAVDAIRGRVAQRVRLSRAVGKHYYLLSGFDIDSNGYEDVAVIDVRRRQRWLIIENPLHPSARERQHFFLGYGGERVEWSRSSQHGLEFVSVRQLANSSRVRALAYSAHRGTTRTLRAQWSLPNGILIPLRLRQSRRFDLGVALYSPAKGHLYLLDVSRGLIPYELPENRCSGYQAVTRLSTSGSVEVVEICSDGSFLVTERTLHEGVVQDQLKESGALPKPIGDVRRADQTRVDTDSGELPVLIALPGSDGSAAYAPEPVQAAPPTSTPEPTNTPTPTVTFTATHTPSPTPSSTPSPTPTGSGFTTGMAAWRVIGQADFTGGTANRGGTVAADTLSLVDGLDFDGTRVAIADRANHRVLLYDSVPQTNGAAADRVLGQSSFTTTTTGCTATGMDSPRGVGLADGKVFVAAANQHRVLIWNAWPSENGASADVVLGQSDLTSCTSNSGGRSAKSFDAWFALGLFARAGRLLVADNGNNRILSFNSPYTTFMEASMVTGQADFTTNAGSASGTNRTVAPPDAYEDGVRMCIPDRLNHRVLLFNQVPSTNGASADLVLGQANFSSTSVNRGGTAAANTMSAPHACIIVNNSLFVADANNHRVLIWENMPTSNGQAADTVLGQEDFVSVAINRGGSPSSNTLRRPTALRYKDGLLFVADQQNHRVLIYRSQHLQ